MGLGGVYSRDASAKPPGTYSRRHPPDTTWPRDLKYVGFNRLSESILTCPLAEGRPLTAINFRIAIHLAVAIKTRAPRMLISLAGIAAARDCR